MDHHSFRWLVCCSGVVLCLSFEAEGSEVDYLTQVKPLIERKCYACHGALKQEAELRLETRALMLTGGDSGVAIVPGDAEASLVFQRVTADEGSRMPPHGEGAALKADEVALLRKWITAGAEAPDEPPPASPLDHWAFRRIERPVLPERSDASNQSANPIDRLLSAKRSEQNLQTQPPAERSLLIRRLYLDLIGLPPTQDQLRDDRSWDEIVDDLLASPHHGERWGRYWMDIWRYSDWYGLGAQLRNSQKHLWHWRDWIVDSLNCDKGYDRMIQEMLAGDELEPENHEVIAGTGYLARNYYLFNRTTWLDSTIEHTGKAFLGLTLNCAKCHDHKYDPIAQLDYYRFRALFEPHQVRLDPVPGVVDFEQDGLPRVFDDHPDAETPFHIRGNPKDVDPDREITPQVPDLFAGFQPDIEPVALPPVAYAPGVRDYVQRDRLQAAESAVRQAESELADTQARLAALKDEPVVSDLRPEESEFDFSDDFETPDADAWEVIGTNWEYRGGSLIQTQATRDTELARLKFPIPRDFEAICRYTTTGGTTYKSVTFRFDRSDDGKYANFVYTSAHAPGPKVQVAYTRDGQHSYPPEGRAARKIEVGRQYELRFAVRDRLVNVWLDDEFLLACLLPDRRPEGSFALSGFDATVAFDSIRIRSLPADIRLTEATTGRVPSVDGLTQAVELAEAKLGLRKAELSALRAVCEADRATYRDHSDNAQTLARIAATRQAESKLAAAAVERLEAGRDEKKRKAADAKSQQAREQLDSIEPGDVTYTSLLASKKALESPAHKESDYPPVYAETSTGRRLALARWMTSRENPLTARVAVNHVWMRHFGEPLVESVFDFGLRTPEPLHVDLLNYLAAEFVDSGWSFKHLHRLIVTSETYRLSCSVANADGETLATDPANDYLWRMNTRRMDAQTVRDSLLHLAGTLELKTGGPSVDVGEKSRRRSLYFKHSRDDRDKFLSMFDDADLLQCYRRSESIVPQQALALANSRISLTAADQIAERIAESIPVDAGEREFIEVACETILGRVPSDEEVNECLRFGRELRALLQDVTAADGIEGRVRARLVHSLLNHNDFISIR